MSRSVTQLLLTLALVTGLQLWAQTSPQGGMHPQQPSGQQPPYNQPSTQQTPSTSEAPPAGQVSVQDQANEAMQRLTTELNLTPDQKTKLQPILVGEIQQARDLRADTSMTLEQKQAKYQQTLVADHAKIQSILTPEQLQKLSDMNQKAREGQQPSAQQPSSQQPPK